jgi:hypothetical protein
MKDLFVGLQGNKITVQNHRWQFTADRLEYVSQKVRHVVSVFYSEWFFNRDIGIPYIPKDGDLKAGHRRLIESALQVAICRVEGIERLIAFSTTLNRATRELTVDFTARVDTGEEYSDTIRFGG